MQCRAQKGVRIVFHEIQPFGANGGKLAQPQHVHRGTNVPCSPVVAGNEMCIRDRLVPAAAAHYHRVDDSEAYFAACVAEGKLWGAFRQGRLAGFVGLHNEGSIGMLEVFADSRRLGIGYCLEAFVIGYCLKKGRTPYAQVVKGNEASMALQKKLGMQQCKKPAIWLY